VLQLALACLNRLPLPPAPFSLTLNLVLLLLMLLGSWRGRALAAAAQIDAKTGEKREFLRSLDQALSALADKARDPETQKALSGLAEDIRFSDPMSGPQLQDIQREMLETVAALQAGDLGSPGAKAVMDDLRRLIGERKPESESHEIKRPEARHAAVPVQDVRRERIRRGWEKYGVCVSCGSTMTLPGGSDERIMNLFNRANYLRNLRRVRQGGRRL
jgi:hypothetical protein